MICKRCSFETERVSEMKKHLKKSHNVNRSSLSIFFGKLKATFRRWCK